MAAVLLLIVQCLSKFGLFILRIPVEDVSRKKGVINEPIVDYITTLMTLNFKLLRNIIFLQEFNSCHSTETTCNFFSFYFQAPGICLSFNKASFYKYIIIIWHPSTFACRIKAVRNCISQSYHIMEIKYRLYYRLTRLIGPNLRAQAY